jgi:flagellar basal-body rod protein FlgG
MDAQQKNLDNITNNLANVNTRGFKKQIPIFQDLMYQQIANGSNMIQQGTGVKEVSADRIFTQGNLQQTGNPLDLAIQGDGFLTFTNIDGSDQYSRDGSLKLNSDGVIVNQNGLKLKPEITIPVGSTNIQISTDGKVSATLPGATSPSVISTITLKRFVNNQGLESLGNNMYKETDSSGKPEELVPGTSNIGTISQGFIETSNVDVAEELIKMISAQRAFELNSKAIQASDQMLQKLTQL